MILAPAGAGLAGFRCTGGLGGLRADVPKFAADAGRWWVGMLTLTDGASAMSCWRLWLAAPFPPATGLALQASNGVGQ